MLRGRGPRMGAGAWAAWWGRRARSTGPRAPGPGGALGAWASSGAPAPPAPRPGSTGPDRRQSGGTWGRSRAMAAGAGSAPPGGVHPLLPGPPWRTVCGRLGRGPRLAAGPRPAPGPTPGVGTWGRAAPAGHPRIGGRSFSSWGQPTTRRPVTVGSRLSFPDILKGFHDWKKVSRKRNFCKCKGSKDLRAVGACYASLSYVSPKRLPRMALRSVTVPLHRQLYVFGGAWGGPVLGVR